MYGTINKTSTRCVMDAYRLNQNIRRPDPMSNTMLPLWPAVKASFSGAERLVCIMELANEAQLKKKVYHLRYSNRLLRRSYGDRFHELQTRYGWPRDIDVCDNLVGIALGYRRLHFHQRWYAAKRDEDMRKRFGFAC
jgi:hypothetical protein